MQEQIPNLWREEEDAPRLYNLYLCRLQMNRLAERTVVACRTIRRYAGRGPGPMEGLFTFFYEIEALCDLGDYKAAWRQLRQRDFIASGERFDLARRKWSTAEAYNLGFYYAPLLFFRGRFRRGCTLLEMWLDCWFRKKAVHSFDILGHVYNEDNVPSHRCRVTLSHFYAQLGKSLGEWRHWDAFVNGFHPRLFRLAAVKREDLLTAPGLLPTFFSTLKDVQGERTISGVGGSQSDLVESAGKVRKRQEGLKRRLAAFRKRIKPVQQRTNQHLEELFPELQRLPK